jgi:hypothetical protein
MQKSIEYPHGLHENDVIFLAQDPLIYTDRVYNALQVRLIWRLCQEFAFQVIENTPNGVSAVRLKPINSQPSAYCETINQLNHAIQSR